MSIRSVVIAAVKKSPGLTVNQLAKVTGIGSRRTGTCLWELVVAERLAVLICTPRKRYFASAAIAEAMRPQCEEESAAHIVMMKARRVTRDSLRSKELKAAYQARYLAKKAAGTLPKYVPKPKRPDRLCGDKTAPKPAPAYHRWSPETEAVNPNNVPVTRLPTPKPRFHCEAPSDGFASMGIGRYAA